MYKAMNRRGGGGGSCPLTTLQALQLSSSSRIRLKWLMRIALDSGHAWMDQPISSRRRTPPARRWTRAAAQRSRASRGGAQTARPRNRRRPFHRLG